jgi:hypothetical protein
MKPMKKIFSTLYFIMFTSILVTAQSNTSTQKIYVFSHETVVKITSSESKKSYKMSYLLNPKTNYAAIKADMSDYADGDMQGESIIIMDNGNSRIFVETQGMKMQMSQSMMGGQQMNNPTDELSNYDYSKIKKTNESKTILGALCYKYMLSDADVTMELWVAPKVKLPNWFIQNTDIINGHIMEYTVTSKEGQMTSTVIAINDTINRTINSKDYKKMF